MPSTKVAMEGVGEAGGGSSGPMSRQSVTAPPPHWTNRYAAPFEPGRLRQPSAQEAEYMLLISSKKSQYSWSLPARRRSSGPAVNASRAVSAHSLLKNSGDVMAQPPASTGWTF